MYGFEAKFAQFGGGEVPAIAVNSATSALPLALEALGVGPKSAVDYAVSLPLSSKLPDGQVERVIEAAVHPGAVMPNIIDRVLAGLALVVLSPFLAVVAALVRQDSGSPVLFRQLRVGQYGQPFRIVKFRTMATTSGAGPMVTVKGDPRVTPLGRRLRSLKIDELPQFWNVVRGDMALVGPRPEVPAYAVSWPIASRDVILSVRPGIFDPTVWQLRREEELLASRPDPLDYYLRELIPYKAQEYVRYVQNKSLITDVKILARAAVAVLFR